MYYERYFKQPSGNVTRKVEKQTELAEWVQVGPRVWERRMREWEGEEARKLGSECSWTHRTQQ